MGNAINGSVTETRLETDIAHVDTIPKVAKLVECDSELLWNRDLGLL